MAETPRKDHWSSLLESIGLATATPQKPAAETASEIAAEVPPTVSAETTAPPKAAAEQSPPVAEPPKPAAKKPAKTSGHWGKLAGMLGLSVAQPEPEPEPEPEPAPAATPAPSPPAAVTNPLDEIRSYTPVKDDLPPDLFAPPARAEAESRPPRERSDRDRGGRGQEPRSRDTRDSRPAEGRRDSRDGERSADRSGPERGRGDRGRGRVDRRDDRPPRRENAPRRGFGEGVADDYSPPAPAAEQYDDFVAPRESIEDSPVAEERLGFDRPADEDGGEHRRRRRRRRRGGRRDEEEVTPRAAVPADEDFDAPAEPFADEPYAAEPYADADDDFLEELPPVDEDVASDEDRPARRAPGDSEGGEDRGPRRRRRRRRGGRRDEAETPRATPTARSVDSDDSDLEDFESDRPAPPASRGRPQREHRRVPSEDDEVDEMLQAELDEDGGEGHAHKKIPTWQETVGVLIDGNMSMRSERPETRGGRGRRPPHRGR